MRKTLLCFFLVLFCMSYAFAAEKPAEKGKEKPLKEMPAKEAKAKEAVKPQAPMKTAKDMTQPELVSYVKDTLGREEDVAKFIPELKKEKDSAGNVFYTYQGTKLENLDKEKLEKVVGRVRNEAVRIRTEKLNKQMATIKRAQAAPGIGGGGGPARTPGVSRIPQAPRLPQVQPRQPNIPKPLPRTPQLPRKIPNTRYY